MNEETLFELARNTPLAERFALLDRECAGKPELRARLDALLAADAAPDHLAHATLEYEQTESFGDASNNTADFPGRDEHVGAILGGKYKLIEEIGEGGMGSVYMAQQTEPVKRLVAVKVIKAGMDSKAVLARFEAERQALAMMDHPNIARVLDAGTTESGRPYFVMELVKGVPITQYCDERKLTPRQRLELFVPVCNAIQHAHQKGVIHRDIKPNNVLVALYDDKPVPKVIDFGVAKAAGQALTEKTLITGFGAVVGTPEYMSPEQANLNNLDIDTRSDVYSLGVLLYELLTGTTPVDRKSLGKAALLEILRIVREVEAPRPSAKLSTIDTLSSVAANRGTEPGKLSKLMKGELDWVLLKALEKDRTRRYDTANGLARDIQRYLADEIVEASPPSAGYRLKKFVRRHKGQVIAVGLVLFALLAGVVGTTLGILEARRQTRIARVEAEEKEKQRGSAEQSAAQARAAQDRGADILDAMTSDATGDTLSGQKSLTSQQRRFLESVLGYYREYAATRGNDQRGRQRAADAYVRLSHILIDLGKFDESLVASLEAVRLSRELVVEQPTVENRRRLGLILLTGGNAIFPTDQAKSLTLQEESVTVFGGLVASGEANMEDCEYLEMSRFLSAQCLIELKRSEEAQQLLEELTAKSDKSKTRSGPATSLARQTLASLYVARGQTDAAVLLLRRTIASHLAEEVAPTRKRYQDEQVAQTRAKLGKLLATQGLRADAERELRAALEYSRKAAADQPGRFLTKQMLTEVLQDLGNLVAIDRPAEASTLFREQIAVREQWATNTQTCFMDPVIRAGDYCNLGNALVKGDWMKESLEWFEKGIGILQPIVKNGVKNNQVQEFLKNCYQGRARAYEKLAQLIDAAADWSRVVEHCLAVDRPWAHFQHGMALGKAGDWKAATVAFNKGLNLREEAVKVAGLEVSEPQWQLAHYFYDLGKVNLDTEQNEPAVEWSGRAVAALETLARKWPGTNVDDLLRWSHQHRAEALDKLGRHSEALKDWDKATELCPVEYRPHVRANRASSQLQAGQVAEAVAEVADLTKSPNWNTDQLYNFACVYALASGKITNKKAEYANRAMELLSKVVKAGYKDTAHMKKDTDLDPLRGREDFKKLIAELEKPPKAAK